MGLSRRSMNYGKVCPVSRSIHPSSVRTPSSRRQSTISAWRWHRWSPPDRRARRLVPLVARRVDQHRRDSLVAGGPGLVLPCAMPINIMVVAGLVAALAAVVDDVVTQVDNILRRLRQYRSQDGGRPRPLFSRPAPSFSPLVYATLITVLAVTPVLLLGGSGGVLRSLCRLLYAGAPGLDGGRPDRHAGPRLAALRGAPLDHRELPPCGGSRIATTGRLRESLARHARRSSPPACRAGRPRRCPCAVAASLVQRA